MSEAATETELSPQRAAELIATGVEVIDVRRPLEYEGGHLAEARNVEMNELPAAADSIDRERPVLFYCRGGNRSAMAVEAFRQAGYEAYNVAGGISAWAAEGLPLEPAGGVIAVPPPPS